jgi:signal transduction histidine kinase/ligand-binding sensor domain-containing protein
MSVSGYPKIFSALAVCFLLIAPVLAHFLPQPSPTQSPLASPSASPTPSPRPTPSPTPLPGAQNFHQWGSITLFNGLPSDSVRTIAQSPDGVMWFGTDNGLARFDGRRIQNFSFGGSEANRVLALKTASTGELWIGTQKGAFVYSENRFQPIEGTEGVGISTILLGDENFLGTDAGLVLRVKADESVPLLFPNPILNTDGNPLGITSLIKKDGQLLAGTSGRGVLMVQDGSVSELSTTPRVEFVNSLAVNADGKLWFGSDAKKGISGIYSIDDRSRAERITAPTANVLALEANESGLWAGTERYGLFHVAESKLTKTYTFDNTSGGLRSDTIFTLFTDREGVIWIGTNRGVSRFDRLGPFQQTVSDIPNSNFIRTLSRGGQLYAGSNRGLFALDEKERWIEVPALKNRAVYAIKQRVAASMIVGTSDGMFDLSGKKLGNGDVRSFADFNTRDYAAVFGRGVVDVTGNDQRVVFDDQTVSSVFGGGDKLWIGTSGHGLFSFDGKAAKLEAGPDVLKSGTIWNMFQSQPEAALFIAGQHGVFSFHNGNVEQIIAAEDVRDVVEIDGQIWAATTTRGLLHARHDDRFGWLVSSIGFEQGLPSEKAFSIRPSGSELIIATNRGIVTYRPGTVPPKLIPARILSQRMHDVSELRSTIELDYPQNSLLVEVAGQSSRTFPEEFQYSFLLKNSRGDIIDSRFSNDPQYAPTDLSPGDYSFESVAYDRDLLSSEPLAIRFSIGKAPFPWTATALSILLAIALVALIWAIVERRHIVQRNRELAAARSDLANEAERERGRIARELHDQTLADLRNLMMKSDRLSPANPEFRTEIESVSTEIRRICEDLSPSVLENVGLVAALEFLLDRSIENHRFSTTEDADENIKFPLTVQLHIYRIAQEILTNIVSHSNADLVEMSVEVFDNEQFLLTIRDNGTSFQPDTSISKGRGITNIRSRASIINAKIAWQERPEGGNIFSLEIAGRG